MQLNRYASAQLSSLWAAQDPQRALIGNVARLYHIEGASQIQIAAALGISRFKVARLLAKAREQGLVEIKIHDLGLQDVALSRQLADLLVLPGCSVVRTEGEPEDVRFQVGAKAAAILSTSLREGEVLGVDRGRTSAATFGQMVGLEKTDVVQLSGAIEGPAISEKNPCPVRSRRVQVGNIFCLKAPVIPPAGVTTRELKCRPDIRRTIERLGEVSTAIVSVGSWLPPNSLIRSLLSRGDQDRLEERGSVVDTASLVLDGSGDVADEELQDRMLSISREQLGQVERVVAVAAGSDKAEAVRHLAESGLVTELVVDHKLAQSILDGAA